MTDHQQLSREELEARRLARGREILAKRRKRRRIIGGVLAAFALVAVALFAFKSMSKEDPSIAAGDAIGKELTEQSVEESNAELEERNARLRRQIRNARKKKAADEKAASQSSGGSTPKSASALLRQVSGSTGVSYGPVGGAATATFGDWSSGAAWSTAKVPVAIALSRQNGGTVTSSMRSAITASDNAGAEAMWDALGSGTRAGSKVDRVFASAGDSSTKTQTSRVRAEYTPFGQTTWSLAAQQRFASQLECLDGSGPVVDLMGQVSGDQSWGLGSVGSDQRFKGGWGPGPSGGYLVRQFGIIRVDGGELAVAIANEPGDGSFATGTQNLNKIASWIADHARGSSSGC